MYIYIYICTYIHIHICRYTYVFMPRYSPWTASRPRPPRSRMPAEHACHMSYVLYIICVYIYIYTYAYTHVYYICVYIYICIYILVYMYVYIYIYTYVEHACHVPCTGDFIPPCVPAVFRIATLDPPVQRIPRAQETQAIEHVEVLGACCMTIDTQVTL